MNYARGFFRLWVFISAVWIAFCVIVFRADFNAKKFNGFDTEIVLNAPETLFNDLCKYEWSSVKSGPLNLGDCRDRRNWGADWKVAGSTVLNALMFPFFSLMLGLIFVWIKRGFH
jgi:hypothetical protein